MQSSKREIFYISYTRLPTEKAHGLATMKLCEAFSGTASVRLVVPRMWRKQKEDPYSYYGVSRSCPITYLPAIDLMLVKLPRKIAFAIGITSFSFVAMLWLLLQKARATAVIFSHDHLPLFMASFVSPRIYYDIHHFPKKNFVYRRILKKAFGFAVQTRWKIGALKDQFDIPSPKVVHFPNGTDVSFFAKDVKKEEARTSLGIPTPGFVAVYTGHLFSWKGVDTLLSAVPLLSDVDRIYIVGGTPEDVEGLKDTHPEASDGRVTLVPFTNRKGVRLWLKAADALILPNSGKVDVSRFYTSPMKLFEYMAAGRAIVASDLPSIREIVDERTAFFFEPDDPLSLADALKKARGEEAGRRAKAAVEEVKKYTWNERASHILSHINSLL